MDARLLIFDDGRGRFGPLADLRAVFELRTGAMTTRQRIEQAVAKPLAALHAPTRLIRVLAERRNIPVNEPLAPGDWFLVNGRWLGVHAASQVRSLPRGQILLTADGQLLAAHLPHDKAQAIIEAGFEAPAGIHANRLPAPTIDPYAPSTEAIAAQRVLIDRPWHILDQLETTLAADLEAIHLPKFDPAAFPQVSLIGSHGCKVAQDAKVMPMVVINTEKGAVVIDSGAQVHSFSILNGPCYIGARSTINAHSDIRANTSIGPSCKIGGEVSFSIIQCYTNKAHLGYLGHSHVGSWVNFGAATTVSNLKNTYGSIRVQLENNLPAEDTGRTFLGPIIGDFTLTAIGSRILTGSCIATGTMLAVSSFAPKLTERFSFHTDDGAENYDIEKFIDMARRMTTRRCCGLKQAEEQLLRAVRDSRSHPVTAAV